MNLLTINAVTKSHTDRLLLDQVDFSVNEGEKVGIIGINGTGKSTLLRILAGLEECDSGSVIKGRNVHVRFLSQNPEFKNGISIYEYVMKNSQSNDKEWDLEGVAKTILNKLGFSDYSVNTDILSGGQKKRVALAAALLTECELLILDEPTNHLDNEMTEWLEEYLMTRKGALVMVTHDRYFLDRVSNRIVEIDRAKLYSYSTNYSGFLALKAEREEMAAASEQKRQSILRVELEWMQRGARARSTKQKAHIARYEALKEIKAPIREQRVEISSASIRMGKTTIEVSEISKAYNGKELFKEFSYIFLKNDRIGFIGKNGCGKSTLMKIITGYEKPDTGNVKIGETIKIGYFSQESEYMDLSMRVIDYIKDTAEYVSTPSGTITASKMLERFLFDSTLQYQLIEKLSGGERRRLYLLKILMEAPNVLILDEPTNDLDIMTLEILEDYLDDFQGIVITVSHDRFFLDRIVKRIFAFEEGGIYQYEGNYSDYAIRAEIHTRELEQEKLTQGSQEQKSDTGTRKRENRQRKLSYKEQKEYDTIEQQIVELEDLVVSIDKQIELAATDFVELNRLSTEKEKTETALNEKMDRWMYLSELVEEIEHEKILGAL